MNYIHHKTILCLDTDNDIGRNDVRHEPSGSRNEANDVNDDNNNDNTDKKSDNCDIVTRCRTYSHVTTTPPEPTPDY